MAARNEQLTFEKRNIVILGMGRQGQALARFFVAEGANVAISDTAPAERLSEELNRLRGLPLSLDIGGHSPRLLEDCDLLCLSGGVRLQAPLVQKALRRGIRLTNDSLLTMQLAPCPVIAITGSSGKTTTTTLAGEMLRESVSPDRTVHVGGNIGTPLVDRLRDIGEDDLMVLELSSFQLELFDPRIAFGPLDAMGPDVAALLNVTPNHLDRHASMAEYARAKSNLLRHLKPTSVVVLGADDPVTGGMAGWKNADGPVPAAWKLDTLLAECRAALDTGRSTIPFSHHPPPNAASRGRSGPIERTTPEQVIRRSPLRQPDAAPTRPHREETGAWATKEALLFEGRPFCPRAELRLRGEHNVSNVLAAAAISGAAGASLDAMGRVARSFAGVPHRLEEVPPKGNILWINDSIATAPERAVAGLQVFPPGAQTLILLAGGQDKNLPWDAFADEVLERVQCLIGFGEAGPMIADKVRERASFRRISAPCCAVVQRLDEAVVLAKQTATPGTVVLFSPGGTSYDAYKNFEQRGEHFRSLVSSF